MATGHSVIDFQYSYGDNNCYTSTKKARSILDKLQHYSSVPEEVRNKADVIYGQMHVKQHRGIKLIQLLYWCCYCAFLELNMDVNPQDLGRVFTLSNVDVARCGSIFSELETGYQPPKGLTTPLNYIPNFCHDLQLSDDAKAQCIALADRIISKRPSLLHESPLNVACGILKYYLIINGIEVDNLRSVINLSDSTVNPWCKVAEDVDNNLSPSDNPAPVYAYPPNAFPSQPYVVQQQYPSASSGTIFNFS